MVSCVRLGLNRKIVLKVIERPPFVPLEVDMVPVEEVVLETMLLSGHLRSWIEELRVDCLMRKPGFGGKFIGEINGIMQKLGRVAGRDRVWRKARLRCWS